jgi:transcriptional regulator with XRE-family HTH domain
VEIKQLLGARIRELRKNRNLTQEQLSEMVGINPKYVSSIERGKENPTLDTCIKIAESLEVSIGELFYQLEAENPEKRMKKIVSLLEQAPEDQQIVALRILSVLYR